MILLFKSISSINSILNKMLQTGIIEDFRIVIRVNNSVSVYILIEKESSQNTISDNLIEYNSDMVEFEYIYIQEKENDPYLKDLFNSDEKLILNSRKNLSNLLDETEGVNKELINSNVITFYSYKGGVGRSTTLASCAAFLSNHYSKKVVIIDCDFEAPGFTNYFLEEPSQSKHHKGVVEYFMDDDFVNEQLSLENYSWEVSKEYSGDGSITIIPAGDLSDFSQDENDVFSSNKGQYLEGLARIDTSSKFSMTRKFNKLLLDIQNQFNPDTIIIDSRTGFNDVFGLTALNFSDLVIGFFSNNAQSLPGLHYFIDRIVASKKGVNALLVNSILSRPGLFYRFQEYVDSYMQSITTNGDSSVVIKSFPLSRYSLLETIGTREELKNEFIDLIKNKRFPDYNDLFEYINDILIREDDYCNNSVIEEVEEDVVNDSVIEEVEKDVVNDSVIEEVEKDVVNDSVIEEKIERSYFDSSCGETHDSGQEMTYTQETLQLVNELLKLDLKLAYSQIESLEKNQSMGVQKELKQRIKAGLTGNWPSLYAENSTEEMKKNIFYRRSMEDVFNENKFIILGNKGTGKTFLYEALKLPEIVERLKERAQKKGIYEFFHIIDIDKTQNKFFDTDLFNSKDESFYHRFWVIFIWNAIMLESEERLGYKSKLVVNPIISNTRTKNNFESIINNDDEFIKIEDDLEDLNKHLKKSRDHKKLVLIFDGLDSMVKPIDWSYKIIPLINYWRTHSYTSISAKLFIRSDLFEKLSNITNVKELKNQAISIEWTQEELFGYFFKLIFTYSKEEFLRYLCFTKNNSFELIKQIKQKAGIDNQITLDKSLLYPLVHSFFGKFASADNSPRYGESYEWFYRNLKNANNTISLRPFIDLINNAFDYSNLHDNSIYPILSAAYYVHGEARINALKNHFKDLTSEQGNHDLEVVCNFIREKKSKNPAYLEMKKNEMHDLLDEILLSIELEHQNKDDLLHLLKLNGVISEHFRPNGLVYSFALLYKYYLGLKSRPKRVS